MPETAKILEELRIRQQSGQRHLHCDHVVAIAANPGLRLTLENLATRCSTCHNAKTMRELNGRPSGIGYPPRPPGPRVG
jgi:5-methylcytosine-specific restriction endonuclease McrA